MSCLVNSERPIIWADVEKTLLRAPQGDRARFAFKAMQESELTLAAKVAICLLDNTHRSLFVTEAIAEGHLQTAERVVRALNYKILPIETTLALQILARQYPKVKQSMFKPLVYNFDQRVALEECGGVFDPATNWQLVDETIRNKDYLTLRLLLGSHGLFPARKLAKSYYLIDEEGKALVREIAFRWLPPVTIDFMTELMLTDCDDEELFKLPDECLARLDLRDTFELLATAICSRRVKVSRFFEEAINQDFGANWILHERMGLYVEFLAAGEIEKAAAMNIPVDQLNYGNNDHLLDIAIQNSETALNALYEAFCSAYERRHFFSSNFDELLIRITTEEEYVALPDWTMTPELKLDYIVKKLIRGFCRVLNDTDDPYVHALCMSQFFHRDCENIEFYRLFGKELVQVEGARYPQTDEHIGLDIVGHILTNRSFEHSNARQVKKALLKALKSKIFIRRDPPTVFYKKRFDRCLDVARYQDAIDVYNHHLGARYLGFAAISLAERGLNEVLEEFAESNDLQILERYEQMGILFALLRHYPVELKFMPPPDPEHWPDGWTPECYDTILSPECCNTIIEIAKSRQDNIVIAMLLMTQPFS